MFDQAGALRADYEAVDWSATPIGEPQAWSPALRQAVDLVWHTRYPATLLWGPEFVLVYNAAYTELIGDKHPWALGRPCQEVFPEAWDVIGPRMAAVTAGEGAWYVEDERLPLVRHGFLEECWFTYGYSAVRGVDGTIEGVIDITYETTRQVIDRRRLELLNDLRTRVDVLASLDDLPQLLTDVAKAGHADLPVLAYRARVETGAEIVPVQDGDGPRTDLPSAPRGPLPETGPLVEEVDGARVAWLPLRIEGAGRSPAMLLAVLNDQLPLDEQYLSFLDLVGASVRQGIARMDLHVAEGRILQDERALSVAIQQSMLPRPSQQPGIEVAVRYQPATHELQIGGDWYDAFVVSDGALALTVGDVTGHDLAAAASMSQVRNILRGIAYTLQAPPSRVVEALDRSLSGLAVPTLASMLLVRVEPDVAGGVRRATWTSAGHLPPVLVEPSGESRFLTAVPDMLLGVLPQCTRHDHEVDLHPGASLVLYTDGLIERRRSQLKDGMGWLLGRVRDRTDLTADELADHVMAELADDVEDDIAVLVLRIAPA